MRRIRHPVNLLAGLFFLAAGAAVLLISRDYPMGTARTMGPGYFPMVLGGLTVLTALVLIGSGLFGTPEAWPSRPAVKSSALVLGGTLLFALLLKPAGLVVASIVLVLVGGAASVEARPVPLLALALGLAIGSVVVFVHGLGQSMPVLGTWFSG
ncbi:MAG TPA: tripartite tricarboxylate transporter TctB family protein [Geminicoccaceae bacterium]|nr:tripartite tricarboxylate transporter TctB family protein [Geminicoccus sp.]HMU51840.1 tripartite tricarboxylate transporter TctB family protein [Geminicoccaceae bacterium]